MNSFTPVNTANYLRSIAALAVALVQSKSPAHLAAAEEHREYLRRHRAALAARGSFPNNLGGYPEGNAGRTRSSLGRLATPGELFYRLTAAYMCMRREKVAPKPRPEPEEGLPLFFKFLLRSSRIDRPEKRVYEAETRSEARARLKRDLRIPSSRDWVSIRPRSRHCLSF